MREFILFLLASGTVFAIMGVAFLFKRPPGGGGGGAFTELAESAIKGELPNPFKEGFEPYKPFGEEDPYEDIFKRPIPAYDGHWSPAYARRIHSGENLH